MSSATITSKKSLFDTFPAKYHHLSQDEPEEQKVPETPVEEKPTEQKSMWKPGGYTPTRAGWHTTRGKIKSYFS